MLPGIWKFAINERVAASSRGSCAPQKLSTKGPLARRRALNTQLFLSPLDTQLSLNARIQRGPGNAFNDTKDWRHALTASFSPASHLRPGSKQRGKHVTLRFTAPGFRGTGKRRDRRRHSRSDVSASTARCEI